MEKIIVFVIRVVYTLSIVGKIILPITFISWLKEIIKHYEFFFLNTTEFIYFIFVVLLFLEIYIIVYLNSSSLAVVVNVIVTFLFLALTLLAYFNGLNGNCGCFGEILSFDNGFDKIVFNSLFFALAILFYLLKKKRKMEFSLLS